MSPTPEPASQDQKSDQAAEARLAFACEIAQEAGAHTLKYFRNDSLGVDHKGDGSPVTVADREAEQLLRERIGERFPEDAILGEEFPLKEGTSGYRWVLDPIDGTKSFIYGITMYTNLVAVLDESTDEPILGVINAPAAREMIYARVGGGAWYQDGDKELVQARVSQTQNLEQALFLSGDLYGFRERPNDAMDVYMALEKTARVTRTWGDAYGYLMVATGRAEVMIDASMSLWDAAALRPVIEEAGGSFTSWEGNPTVQAEEAVATNVHLAEAVLSLTRGR